MRAEDWAGYQVHTSSRFSHRSFTLPLLQTPVERKTFNSEIIPPFQCVQLLCYIFSSNFHSPASMPIGALHLGTYSKKPVMPQHNILIPLVSGPFNDLLWSYWTTGVINISLMSIHVSWTLFTCWNTYYNNYLTILLQ